MYKSGDIVTITNKTKNYPYYESWAEKNGMVNFTPYTRGDRGDRGDNEIMDGMTGKVIVVGPHLEYYDRILAGIHVNELKRDIIINITALTPLISTHFEDDLFEI